MTSLENRYIIVCGAYDIRGVGKTSIARWSELSQVVTAITSKLLIEMRHSQLWRVVIGAHSKTLLDEKRRELLGQIKWTCEGEERLENK